MTEPWTPAPWVVEDDPSFGHVWGPNDADVVFELGTNPADARLISLAPDMAELLDAMCGAPWAEDESLQVTKWRQAGRRILDRARGETDPTP